MIAWEMVVFMLHMFECIVCQLPGPMFLKKEDDEEEKMWKKRRVWKDGEGKEETHGPFLH